MPLAGRWAFTTDEGFRVTFRRVDRGRAFAIYALASTVVIAGTLWLLVGEPFDLKAWVVAGCLDLVLLGVLGFVRHLFVSGPFIVDASEKRLFFPGGNDLEFSALKGLRLERNGPVARLTVVLNTEELPLGWRPAAEVEKAAQAVTRLTGLPVENT